VDLQTGKVTKIADGSEPAWSPSRDWIAYYGPKGDQIWIVHPDATGNQLLATLPPDNWPHLGGTGSFIEVPVWSPDSGRILLNESWNPDKDTFAIHIVDILTHKMTRELKDKAPVWGWAEAK
jgi:Tol biopolymer transport system component